jgi:hypothetical protein
MFNGINRQCGNDVARVVVTAMMINYEQSIGAIFGCSFGECRVRKPHLVSAVLFAK